MEAEVSASNAIPKNCGVHTVMAPLSETLAELAAPEGNAVQQHNIILPRRPPAVYAMYDFFGLRSFPIIMPLQSVVQRGDYIHEICRVNVGGRGQMIEARVRSAVAYATQCSDLRDAFNLCVRFVAHGESWWNSAAKMWVEECFEFIMTYGESDTPRDIIHAYKSIESRLCKITNPPHAKH